MMAVIINDECHSATKYVLEGLIHQWTDEILLQILVTREQYKRRERRVCHQ